MMRDKIISDLFKSREFNDCISKMRPEHLQEDLRSEVMLILCEKPEGDIMDLHYKGVLKYYTVRIILNLIQSNTSPFYKKFRNSPVSLNAILDESSYHIASSLGDSCDVENIQQSKFVLQNSFALISSELTELRERQLKECLALDEIDNLYWYDKEIVKLYLKLKTFRAVEEETGIPFESVYKTIKRACKEIKRKVA